LNGIHLLNSSFADFVEKKYNIIISQANHIEKKSDPMTSKTQKMVTAAAVIALALALLMIGYYVLSLMGFLLDVREQPNSFSYQIDADEPPPKWDGKERVNILLLGTDTRSLRPDETPRSDMMLVASLDPQTKSAAMFSILRDTYVKIPGYFQSRVNTALALGGPELAMQTVGDLLGLPIQYYVTTDFEGFIALVDALGGVTLDVEKSMKYTDSADKNLYDIDLKKGLQQLDGKQALQYVRFRYDAMSDFTRTERQRKFLNALMAELKSGATIVRLPSILRAIEPYLKTNLSLLDMTKLAALAYDFNLSDIPGMQVPPTELIVGRKVNGASVLTVEQAQLQPLITDFLQQSTRPPDNQTAEAPLDSDS
jgi:LCP family protein required for cell wall assembly